MKGFWGRFATREFRWPARILGTLCGLVALMGLGESLGYLNELKPSGYLLRLGFLLVLGGSVAGWFKELIASILILAGSALLIVTSLTSPGALALFLLPAFVGLLYLFTHLGLREK